MRITQAIVRIKPETAELYEATFRAFQAKVLANEPGTVFFQLCRDPEQPGGYRVFEAYRDEDAIAEHVAKDYYKEATRIFLECLAGDNSGEIANQGQDDPRAVFGRAEGLKLERFETI
jgi:quinol monooxygenase YgiN